MLCNRVVPYLSEYFDEVLESDAAVEVSQHLRQCVACRKQYKSLVAVHTRLRSLERVQAPEYLEALVRLRIARAVEESWYKHLRQWLELCWSRIRTTETMWYWTRAIGTALTSICFLLINPLYFDVNQLPERPLRAAPYTQQVGYNVLQRLGLAPADESKAPPVKVKPAINEAFLYNYAASIPDSAADDTLSVIAAVDSNGAAQIKNVLQYPTNRNLLSNFNQMISSARYRPASQNGKAVDSHIVLTYSRISVWD